MTQAALIPYYLQKDQTEKVLQYADNVVLELNKLTAYTERIQRLSNNSSEYIILNKENISINDFFGTIKEKYQAIKEKQVDIRLLLTTAYEYIEADKIHFANIIENLIENAIKYSGESVFIELKVDEAETSQMARISIKDNGFGIMDSDIVHIFDKFFRSSDKAIQQQVGFGLGLTYVKALVEAHNGSIRVASKAGEGTDFELFIPTVSNAQ